MLLRCNEKSLNKRNKVTGICDFLRHLAALFVVGDLYEPTPSYDPPF